MASQGPDVAIVGAGAAGLMAAIHAAERGRRVLLLEKNRKPGAKVLMSGGTRCNITHACSWQKIAEAFPRQAGRFLRPSLRFYGPEQVIAFFEKAGVAVKVEAPHDKVFPRSDRAADVQRALVETARARGVELRAESPVRAVERREKGFALRLDAGDVVVPRVLVTTGGQSYPGCGTTGDGYGFARAVGHRVVTPHPALVPLVLARPLEDCSGVTLEDVRLGLAVAGGGKLLAEQRGELLFTHRGLSGPTALDLSGEMTARTSGVRTDVAAPRGFEVALDLLPSADHERVQDELAARDRGRASRPVSAALHALGVPRRLAKALLDRAQVPEARTAQELRREERTGLVRALKDLRLAVTGTVGFEKAEVTAGGVSLDEVDPGTLESKIVPGLFFAGEVLDVAGPIGGYNFQAAWSTGFAAAERF